MKGEKASIQLEQERSLYVICFANLYNIRIANIPINSISAVCLNETKTTYQKQSNAKFFLGCFHHLYYCIYIHQYLLVLNL